jgi:hypothetical protein
VEVRRKVLYQETGYNIQTISEALKELCALTIDGQPVLLARQNRTQGANVVNW